MYELGGGGILDSLMILAREKAPVSLSYDMKRRQFTPEGASRSLRHSPCGPRPSIVRAAEKSENFLPLAGPEGFHPSGFARLAETCTTAGAGAVGAPLRTSCEKTPWTALSSEGLLLDELDTLLEGHGVGLLVVLGPRGEVVEELELLELPLQGVG
ncbi:MAG: hypothetical protein SGPRY_006573 [Prymnesium sp.]